jgi:hypothetical protein
MAVVWLVVAGVILFCGCSSVGALFVFNTLADEGRRGYPTPSAWGDPATVEIGRGNTPPPDAALQIVNATTNDICAVHVSSPDDDSWGDNDLAGLIRAGATGAVALEYAEADVLIADCAGQVLTTARRQKPGGQLTAGRRGADTVEIILRNEGTVDVCYVMLDGEDLLGEVECVLPGHARWFFVPAGTYDMQALDLDKNPLSTRNARKLTPGRYTWYVPDR